jgi:hypothetical protein
MVKIKTQALMDQLYTALKLSKCTCIWGSEIGPYDRGMGVRKCLHQCARCAACERSEKERP